MSASIQGVGLGLRNEFLEQVLTEDGRRPDFLEVFPHQFEGIGGRPRQLLRAAASRYPIVPHCVGASLGGFDPLDAAYLDAVEAFITETRAPWWSDHLSWSGHRGAHFDLLPLAFTHATVERFIARARAAQTAVGAPLALENVSSYLRCPDDEMDEATFIERVLEGGDFGLLLDVNNVVVNCLNFGGNPYEFIDRMPLDRVVQIHVSGHTPLPHLVLDTHVCPVPESVWALYRYTLARAGRMIPTLLEWDAEIPEFELVLQELERTRSHARLALGQEAA